MHQDDPYLFYEIMNYPVPFNQEVFSYSTTTHQPEQLEECELSWAKPGPYLQEFLEHIEQYGRLYRSLPFVDRIYLANSITFNALHEGSDIDLFFVIKDGRMWTARFFSAVMFFVCGLKRFHTRVHKKFCLTFYVTDSGSNLLPIKHTPHDPYLIYWLAHLVPIYDGQGDRANQIYEDNERIEDYLPNFPGRQAIFLGNRVFTGRTSFKRLMERVLRGWFGDLVEGVIKFCWLPILFWKRRRLGPRGADIIISDRMLKFHADKRRMIATKWKVGQGK